MKYHILQGEINSQSAQSLLDFIGDNDGDLTICINSGGGDSAWGRVILMAMNENADRIRLWVVGGAYSAAMRIFTGFNGVRGMVGFPLGMLHLTTYDLSIMANGKPKSGEDEMIYNRLENENMLIMAEASTYMADDELERLSNGEDVWFSYERMLEIYEKTKAWKK